MIVVDEYLATRVVGGDWPLQLPDDEFALPASHHWRLLQALHGGQGGQLTRILAALHQPGVTAYGTPTLRSSPSWTLALCSTKPPGSRLASVAGGSSGRPSQLG